jgi:CRP-like cAMP-binding protein
MKRSDARARLASRGWLSEIDRDLAAAVLQGGRRIALRKGEGVYYPGDDPGGMYGVVEGGIILSLVGRNGLPVPAHIMRTCNWFGYASIFDRQKRRLVPVANEPSQVLHVSLTEIERLRGAFPNAHAAFGKLAIFGEAHYIAAVSDLLITNTDQRMAAVLLRVTGAVTPEVPESVPVDPQIDLWASANGVPLTQASLAEMANASAHTVARFVERMVEAGWVDWKYRQARILDREALKAFAAGASAGHGLKRRAVVDALRSAQ